MTTTPPGNAEIQPPAATAHGLRIAIDLEAVRGYQAEHSCLLRLKIDSDFHVFREVVATARLSNEVLPSTRHARLLPGDRAQLSTTFVPMIAGQHELHVVVTAVHEASGATFRITVEALPLRVAASGPSVQHIHIDQSSARVVDNSRSSFGVAAVGGLLEGDWKALAIKQAEIVATVGESRSPAGFEMPPAHQTRAVAFSVTTGLGRHEAHQTLAQGDIATIYDAVSHWHGVDVQSMRVVLKIADDRADNDLMMNEARVLDRLHAVDATATVKSHLPRLVDRFRTDDGRVGHALEKADGIDLFEVRRRLPEGLPPRHLVWLLRRTLGTLAFVHAQGILHGNLDPAHIVVRAHDHMVWIVDWCWAMVEPARTGDRFKALNEDMSPPEVRERKAPLPASDLYALGKTMFVVAGGDPKTKTLPPMDERLERFLRFMVVESPRGRAQDALELYKELDRLRERIWGPHTFVPLTL